MNKYSIIVFKAEDGDWIGEVNGDGNPIYTGRYGFDEDPEGHRARAAVLFESNAIIESKTRFEHVASALEVQYSLAAFVRGYVRNVRVSPEMATALFVDSDFSEERIRDAITASVDARDTLGATIGHALIDYLDERARKRVVSQAFDTPSVHPVARAVEAR